MVQSYPLSYISFNEAKSQHTSKLISKLKQQLCTWVVIVFKKPQKLSVNT